MIFTLDECQDGTVVVRRNGEVFFVLRSRFEATELFNVLNSFISEGKA